MVDALVDFRHIAALWVRSSMAYRTSFWLLTLGGFLISGIDFVGIWILFQNVGSLGGFTLHEVAFLYGGSGLALAVADFVVGRIERIGQMVRLGRLDSMMVRPVPLLVQVCADEFALRRLARIAQAALVFGWAASFVEWTPARVLVGMSMVASGSVIFVSLFVGLACLQFWTADSAEVANAFTYGGNTLTQYPLTVFPTEVVKTLTFVLPLAFVNWYPSLFILDRPDPLGLPSWTQLLSPVVAAGMAGAAALAWRSGVRHYRSTGS